MVSVPLNSLAPGTPGAGRVTVLCQDVPYPAYHGGRLDLWNLIRGLRKQGATLQLVCWVAREPIAPAVRQVLQGTAADVVEVGRRDSWRRLLNPRYPPRMLAFLPSRVEREALMERVRRFAPDWVLFDHWAAYLPARMLARELDRPLVYRSQNVEYLYYRELRRVARGTLKLKLALNAWRLFPAEREIRTSADLVADISDDDREAWTRMGGAGHGLVVPPVWIDEVVPVAPHGEQDIDVLFVGNLRTPNNVEGLSWFASRVLPILRNRLTPRAPRVVFAGSDPAGADAAAWRRAGVECEANPVDVATFYRRARVVVNPLQRGSGVNLKMIEALAAGRPVVATPAAIRGLPAGVRSYYDVCDTPEAFASAVADALSASGQPVDPRERATLIERHFGPANLQPLIAAIDDLRRSRGVSVGSAG